jgi:hypothetical protein
VIRVRAVEFAFVFALVLAVSCLPCPLAHLNTEEEEEYKKQEEIRLIHEINEQTLRGRERFQILKAQRQRALDARLKRIKASIEQEKAEKKEKQKQKDGDACQEEEDSSESSSEEDSIGPAPLPPGQEYDPFADPLTS